MFVSPEEGVKTEYTLYPIHMTSAEVISLENTVHFREKGIPCTYRSVLDDMFKTKSTHSIDNSDKPSTPAEIKYILNRIAANLSDDPAFELTRIDNIKDGDKWAPLIARAFQDNTKCTLVTLQIGLSDEGAKTILNTLRHNELDELILTDNHFTEKTFSLLNQILCEPNNRWKRLYLDRPTVNEDTLQLKNFTLLKGNSKVEFKEPYTEPSLLDRGRDIFKCIGKELKDFFRS